MTVSYENEFIDNMIKNCHKRLISSFHLCYRSTDDLIVLNNKKCLDYLKEIYSSQLTNFDFTFITDSGGKLSTRLYDKHDFLHGTFSSYR